MARLFQHSLFLIALAAVCYAMAIFVTGGRVGFIVFLVVGLLTEFGFWSLFWRKRRIPSGKGAESHT